MSQILFLTCGVLNKSGVLPVSYLWSFEWVRCAHCFLPMELWVSQTCSLFLTYGVFPFAEFTLQHQAGMASPSRQGVGVLTADTQPGQCNRLQDNSGHNLVSATGSQSDTVWHSMGAYYYNTSAESRNNKEFIACIQLMWYIWLTIIPMSYACLTIILMSYTRFALIVCSRLSNFAISSPES